jgi:very-short-patch-repair endonuclease
MPERQYQFDPERKWAADFCWPGYKLIVEVDGGIYAAGRGKVGPGRHTRGSGLEADHERDAEALCLGYRVLRVTPKQITDGKALGWIERLLK